jgi:hypothetical protein
MKRTVLTASILTAALLTFAAGNTFAQHEMHHPDGSVALAQSQTSPAQPAATGSAMGGGMMAKMMDRQKQTSDLVAKLMASMDTIESEKNATALKQKLTEHRALLEQLQKQTSMGEMMKNMPGMMGNDANPSAK